MITYCNTVIRTFLIGCHIFLDSLLPECFYEAMLLDVLLSNNHI